ncbi:MAG: hypothetical protein WD696_14260 [Bryobacteraceae bacterium]
MTGGILFRFARRARRRFLWNEILAQAAWASSAALAGFIALLLAGTQVLDWRLILVVAAAALAAGMVRTMRRLPSAYAVAQQVDRRLGLADAISTALHFAGASAGANGPEPMRAIEVRRAQREQTERTVASLDVRLAVPFTVPRAVYAMGVLGLLASSLFALRYGITRRLDLKPPLTAMLLDTFGIDLREWALLQPKKQPRKSPQQGETPAIPVEDGSEDPAQLDAAPDSALDVVDIPDVNAPTTQATDTGSKQKGSKAGEEGGEEAEGEAGDGAEESAQGGESADGESAGGKQGSQQAKSPSGKQGQNSGNDNSGLMAKLRDAMANLMSRVREQNGQGSESQSGGQKQQASNKQPGGGQKGSAGQGQQKSAGQPGSEASDGQSGDDAQDANNTEARAGGKGSDKESMHAPGSGMGKQDGLKDVKLAEQLEAMGKISEIIGKRSASVTGDITIEVQSSRQQLKTPYSQRNAAHVEAGGEISRDEIPVIYQHYVQQYFEHVRKAPAAKTP